MQLTTVKQWLKILVQLALGSAIYSLGEYYLGLETLPLKTCTYMIFGGLLINCHGVVELIELLIKLWKSEE